MGLGTQPWSAALPAPARSEGGDPQEPLDSWDVLSTDWGSRRAR